MLLVPLFNFFSVLCIHGVFLFLFFLALFFFSRSPDSVSHQHTKVCVWKGFIQMTNLTKFSSHAYLVSGPSDRLMSVRVLCVCVCCACVRACVRARVRACVCCVTSVLLPPPPLLLEIPSSMLAFLFVTVLD